MKRKNILTGCILMLAATGFWLSWFLMPDPGTNDTVHILSIVKQARGNVMNSVIIQIITSVVYVVALFLLTQISFPLRKTSLLGIIFLGIGSLGLCADAFFHLLAWFMTDNSVTIQKDVVTVMEFMQTTGVVFLIPLLLSLFIGSMLLAIGMNKQGLITKRSKFIIATAFLVGCVIAILNKLGIYGGPVPTLAILGIFAAGQGAIGLDLAAPSKKNQIESPVF